ncbi:MAG: ABC transporter substrate-binding protein [Gemmatales bacterium]|nr:ABC transporter substrate-binding protein [Gemmatales bacterium]MDW7994922.1 ABC transporter substrate-binding protein [Gemmatales bacterium]
MSRSISIPSNHRICGLGLLCLTASIVLAMVSLSALAQTPVDEKEEAKPPKVRTDLPILPPLETLAKAAVSPLGELLLEAERIQHPAVRDLLRRLGYPHDRVVLRDGKTLRVAPLPRRFETDKLPQLKVQVVDATGQVEAQRSLLREEVQRVDYYEVFAIQEALQLAQEANQLKPAMTRSQALQVVDFIIEQVRTFHTEALRQGLRGEGWDEIRQRLEKQERQIRVERLQVLQQEERFDEAVQWADRLLSLYPGDAEMVAQFRQLIETTSDRALARGDFAAVRRALDRLRTRLPGTTSPAIERFQRVLQERADFHLKQAQKLQESGDLVAAWLAGAEAARLLPNWERVQLFQRQLLREYPLLIIGVPDLPQSISPAQAWHLPEQIAVALTYEWLVEPRQPPLILQGYWSSPGFSPYRDRGGWRLALTGGTLLAGDPTGERPVQAQDIRFSLEYAGLPQHGYYDPRWDRRWTQWTLRHDSAGFLILERAMPPVDPLSLLNVPILVAGGQRVNDSSDATKSNATSNISQDLLGTGPYMLVERTDNEWVFRARPGWSRPHAPDGPSLREIRLRRYRDARQAHEDLECGAFHLVVGLTARDADLFSNIPHARTVCLARQEAALTGFPFTPRVAWLGFNRRRPVVASQDLRQAISVALDRDSLLRNFLRGRDPTTYRVSGGPIPLASWAYHPDYSPIIRSPYRPALARELFQKVRAKVSPNEASSKTGSQAPLTSLITWVVADDSLSQPLVQALADQLATHGVKLDIRRVTPQELWAAWLKSDVPYDALLWITEYPHEGITPFRWLSPAPPGQTWPDPFGLAEDPVIAQLRQRYLQAEDFTSLRATLHQLHAYLVEQAWVVPLWEVDSFVACWQSLRVGRFHPLWAVHHAEIWSWN